MISANQSLLDLFEGEGESFFLDTQRCFEAVEAIGNWHSFEKSVAEAPFAPIS